MNEYVIAFQGGLAATFATLVASFSGGGLSLILFPILLFITPYSYVSLLTVAKVSATLMTITSTRIHAFKNKLDYKFILHLALFQVLGTALGTYFLQYKFNENLFKTLLAWTIVLTASYLFFSKKIGLEQKIKKEITKEVYIESAIVCFLISILNGLFGGTGIFITIYLLVALKMSFIESMKLVMPSCGIVNFIQSLYLLFSEWVEWKLVACVVLGSIVGSFFGTRLQYLKGNLWVKRAAVIVMYVIGVRTLL